MNKSDAALNVVQAVSRESTPRCLGQQKAKPAPGVDRDAAIAELGDQGFEPLFADLFDRFGMDQNVAAQSAMQRIICIVYRAAQIGFGVAFVDVVGRIGRGKNLGVFKPAIWRITQVVGQGIRGLVVGSSMLNGRTAPKKSTYFPFFIG